MEEKEIIKRYSNDDITIVWKPKTCIHSKKCWKELLQVFDPRNRPWINMEGATTERIKTQVDACPSGALSYINKNAESSENTAQATKINILENGPLLVHGTLEVEKADGTTETKVKKTAFCRCGASAQKPYCDGSHNTVNFIG